LGNVCDEFKQDTSSGAMICRLPVDLEYCQPAVGCDLTAEGGKLKCDVLQGTSGPIYLCVVECATGDDCYSAGDSCQGIGGKTICYSNVCADPSCPTGSPAGCTAASERAKYFQPCPSSGSADGICIPLPGGDFIGSKIDFGVCFETGTSTGTCEFNGVRAHPDKLCSQGQFCEPVQPNAAGDNFDGNCRPVCNAATTPTPAKTCDAGSVCVDSSWLYVNLSDLITISTDYPNALPGLCMPSCDLLSATNSCAQDSLGNNSGCASYVRDGTLLGSSDGVGFCEAVLPTAAKAGQTCKTAYAFETCDHSHVCDLRSPCSGSLVCDDIFGQSGTCVGWCDTSKCTANTTCTACADGRALQSVMNQ
jgi:hypothetical protein